MTLRKDFFIGQRAGYDDRLWFWRKSHQRWVLAQNQHERALFCHSAHLEAARPAQTADFWYFWKNWFLILPPCVLTYQDDLIWMKCSFWAKFFAAFEILRISLEAVEICQYKPWRRPISKSFLYLKIAKKFKDQQKIWPKTYVLMGFGQWPPPYKGENGAQSSKSWKCDVLHCSSGLPAPTSSFPVPEIFLRMCLTIARSMAGSIGRSLGPKNWPQSRKKQTKRAKIALFWKKSKIIF